MTKENATIPSERLLELQEKEIELENLKTQLRELVSLMQEAPEDTEVWGAAVDMIQYECSEIDWED